MKTAWLSLGSNVGDREANLREAMRRLEAEGIHIRRESSLYETEPQNLRDQPWFLNSVVEVETTLFPRQLLASVRKIEKALGRKKTVAKGPRTIDIDILLYGSAVIQTAELEIPHPRMSERRFVLEPLAEMAPDLRHPASRKTMRELLSSVAGQVVRRR